MKICGTVERPPERPSISVRSAGFPVMSISVKGTFFSARSSLAAEQ
jgi:hypothetical protein